MKRVERIIYFRHSKANQRSDHDLYFLRNDQKTANAYRAGALDGYRNAPEQGVSSGTGVPCGHCLNIVPEGEGFLVVAHRPFSILQPYAETGPIFICQPDCSALSATEIPQVLEASPEYLIKGYTSNQRIKYGTGAIVPKENFTSKLSALLARSDLAFVDLRSAKNNCWLTRVTRQT